MLCSTFFIFHLTKQVLAIWSLYYFGLCRWNHECFAYFFLELVSLYHTLLIFSNIKIDITLFCPKTKDPIFFYGDVKILCLFYIYLMINPLKNMPVYHWATNGKRARELTNYHNQEGKLMCRNNKFSPKPTTTTSLLHLTQIMMNFRVHTCWSFGGAFKTSVLSSTTICQNFKVSQQ